MSLAVENRIYQIKFFPRGVFDGQGTHLSIGLTRMCLPSLNSNETDTIDNIKVLKHS